METIWYKFTNIGVSQRQWTFSWKLMFTLQNCLLL